MKKIVQTCVATGWGGLEMVICDFHSWLIQEGISAKVVCLKGSPLERNLIRQGFAKDILVVEPGIRKYWNAGRILKQLDSPETGILFHRQQGAKMLKYRSFQAKVSVLCHTFFDVRKKDLYHRYLFSKVNNWIVLTNLQKNNLFETIVVSKENVQVIPNGVNLNRFKPKTASSAKKSHFDIALVARLDPQKGQDIALEALRIISSSDSSRSFRLHLFGEDTVDGTAIRPMLENTILEKKLQGQVVFHGHTEHLEAELIKMDLLWMPSQRETFGRCVLEAMACKIPVIASAAGAVPDIIRHEENGLLFAPGSAEDLAFQTNRLASSPLLSEKISTTAMNDVHSKYDSEIVWRRILSTVIPVQKLQTERNLQGEEHDARSSAAL